MFDLPIAAAFYCAVVASVFLGLWLYYDRREHSRFELERRKVSFHCIRCDQLYVARAGTELHQCPQCGHENSRLKF